MEINPQKSASILLASCIYYHAFIDIIGLLVKSLLVKHLGSPLMGRKLKYMDYSLLQDLLNAFLQNGGIRLYPMKVVFNSPHELYMGNHPTGSRGFYYPTK